MLEQINCSFSSSFTSLEDIFSSKNQTIIQQLDKILSNIKILDGAVGEGEFLESSLSFLSSIKKRINQTSTNEKMSKSSISNPEFIISNNLYGMEIDPVAQRRCHDNLLSHIPENNQNTVKLSLKNNILLGNFLDCSFKSWDHLSLDEGFSIVIGNPPWGGKLTKSEKDYYQKKYSIKSPKRNLNSFELFVYQAVNLLIPSKGILAYLLPKNVSRSNQYIYLRNCILNNFRVIKLNFHGLFHDVTQEFISLIASRTNTVPSDHTIAVNDELYIPQSFYSTNIDFIFSQTYDPKSQQIVKHIHKDSKPLSEFFSIRRGEELSKRGGVMLCTYCSEWVPLSSRKRNITCPRCLKPLEKQKLNIKYLIQKDKDSMHLQPILTGDDFDEYSIRSTHHINPSIKFKSKKNPQIYTSPKLVMQKIKRYPCVAYDSSNYWTTQNVYIFRLTSKYVKKPEILYYTLAILNSSLIRWYYENQFNLGSEYTNAISIRNLRRFPIKKPNYNDPRFWKIIDRSKEVIDEKNNKVPLIKDLNRLILDYYDCQPYISTIEAL